MTVPASIEPTPTSACDPTLDRRRDVFFDVIRAVAIVRVVAWHAFQWVPLSYIAAMPVMFYVGGTMARSSFERRAAWPAIRARLRRLLPPLWSYAAFTWFALLVTGVAGAAALTDPPWRLLWWALPIADPTGPEDALAWWAPLWYLRAYLWLVMLTPLLLRARQRFGTLRTAAATALASAGVAVAATVDSTLVAPALRDVVLYGLFWTLGLATRELRLVPLARDAVVRRGVAAVCAISAVGWMVLHPSRLGIVNASPVAELLLGTAWVVGLTTLAAPLRRVGTTSFVSPLVALLNRRAVTIYLWHCAAIAIAHDVLETTGAAGGTRTLAFGALVVGVTAAFVSIAGPIEDLGARRRRRSRAGHARGWSPVHSVGALACALLLVAAVPAVDLQTTETAYIPASGRGLDRLIEGPVDGPASRTPVVRAEGPVVASEVHAVLQAWSDDWDMTGVVAAIGRSDGLTLSAAAGVDESTGDAMHADQAIPTHSITKSFTGALVAQLAAEGALSLDDSLAVWMPEFPHASRITLRQLAQHSSGLVDTGEPPDAAISIAASTPLLFEPGSDTRYADSAYFLLAEVAERATQHSYDQLLRDRLFVPVGLDGTVLQDTARWSAGGVWSTVDDLVRWAPVFWGGGLGDGVAIEARTLDPHNSFGIGTFGYCPCDGAGLDYLPQFYGHLSGQGRLAWDPIDDLAVMIHTNEENDGGRTIDAWHDLDRRLRDLASGRPIAPATSVDSVITPPAAP